jgi:hypothetical protein
MQAEERYATQKLLTRLATLDLAMGFTGARHFRH